MMLQIGWILILHIKTSQWKLTQYDPRICQVEMRNFLKVVGHAFETFPILIPRQFLYDLQGSNKIVLWLEIHKNGL